MKDSQNKSLLPDFFPMKAMHHTNDLPTPDMHSTEVWQTIRCHGAFNGITDGDLRKVLGYFRVISIPAGEILIHEGTVESTDLLLILEGDLQVVKRDPGADRSPAQSESAEFRLAVLSAGDIAGEMGFITGELRTATIRSATPCWLLSINRHDFDMLEQLYPQVYARILRNITVSVVSKVKQTSENEVRGIRLELENSLLNSRSNLFFSYVIGLLCVYNLVIHIIISLSANPQMTSLISALIIVLFATGLVMMVRHSKLPLEVIGLATQGWKRSVRESLTWTALIIALCVGVKWILIQTVPRYEGLPMFSFDLTTQQYLAFNFILYGLHSPIQEFIARGVLQGSLQHFFTGKNITLRAIVVSNALFSATHVHLMNGMLALLVFIPGLFWGWLYSRHNNLIGVSISHLIIGWMLLFFMDLEKLF